MEKDGVSERDIGVIEGPNGDPPGFSGVRVASAKPLTGKRCLLVEDESEVARGLARLLDGAGAIVTSARSFCAARELLSTNEWHLVVADLLLPDGDGAEFAVEVALRNRSVGIVIISGRVDYWAPSDPRLLGAQFCHKSEARDGLVPAALMALLRSARFAKLDESPSSPTLRANPVAQLAARFPLTLREGQVFGLLLQGCGTKEVADRLRISESTAGRHAEEIYRKSGVKCQRQFFALLTLMLVDMLRAPAPKSA